MIQPEFAAATIGPEALDHTETGARRQTSQFLGGEMVDVANAIASPPPIDQIIAALQLVVGEADRIPRDDSLLDVGDGHKIPDGKRHPTPRGNKPADFFGPDVAQGGPREVVQDGECAEHVEPPV